MLSLAFLHAHPDDEVLATGGTMAQLAAEGHNVTVIFATRGEVGEVPEGFLEPGVSLGKTREAEARKAAEILGCKKIEFLDYQDSGLENTVQEDPSSKAFCNANVETAAEDLVKILNEISADILTVYDPNGGYGHPDHIQVHRVGTRASEIAQKTPKLFWATMNRDHFMRMREASEEMRSLMDESQEPEAENETPIDQASFGWPESEITHFINVTDYLEQKIEALKAHASQIGEDSFFAKMSKELQRETLGTEWYVQPSLNSQPLNSQTGGGAPGSSADVGSFRFTSLLDD